MFGCEYPATCLGVTSPDNAILSPQLAGKVTNIQVADDTWVATHRPVFITLCVDAEVQYKRHMVFPRQFPTIALDKEALQAACDHKPPDPVPAQDLEAWGRKLEKIASVAVSMGATSLSADTKLSKAFKGRCKPRKVIQSPVLDMSRADRQGGYEPSHEVVSMPAQKQVKQHRRVISFTARIRAHHRKPFCSRRQQDLELEWNAIATSRAFGESFLHWLHTHLPEVGPPMHPLPASEWLQEVSQFTKFTVEATLRSDFDTLQRKEQFRRMTDKQNGSSKQAFAMVRGKGKPLVKSVHNTVEGEGIAVTVDDSTYEIYLPSNVLSQMSVEFPLLVHQVYGQIVGLHQQFLVFQPHADHEPLPQEVYCKQTQHVIHPPHVASELNKFWQPIWQAAPFDVSFLHDSSQSDDLMYVPPVPEHLHIDLSDHTLWSTAVSALKAGSARGPDGISAQEIKDLPEILLHDLASVLQTYQHGFPRWYMIGFICPLAKVEGTPEAHQSRPVTILSQTYRLWGKTIFSVVSGFFAKYIPAGVTGLLPGRGAHSAAFHSQLILENSRVSHKRRSGVTLDLQKCFNKLVWPFVFSLMHRMGLPLCLLKQ